MIMHKLVYPILAIHKLKGSHASIIKCFSVMQNSMPKKKVDVKLSNLPS
jgi:hypothetical protein